MLELLPRRRWTPQRRDPKGETAHNNAEHEPSTRTASMFVIFSRPLALTAFQLQCLRHSHTVPSVTGTMVTVSVSLCHHMVEKWQRHLESTAESTSVSPSSGTADPNCHLPLPMGPAFHE